MKNLGKSANFYTTKYIFLQKYFVSQRKRPTFATAIEDTTSKALAKRRRSGPFVYRLGREIFIL